MPIMTTPKKPTPIYQPRPGPRRPPDGGEPMPLPIAAEIADPVLPSHMNPDGAANFLGAWAQLLVQDGSRGVFGLRGQKMNAEASAYQVTREATAMIADGAAGLIDEPMVSLIAAMLGRPTTDVWAMLAKRVQQEVAILAQQYPDHIAAAPAAQRFGIRRRAGRTPQRATKTPVKRISSISQAA